MDELEKAKKKIISSLLKEVKMDDAGKKSDLMPCCCEVEKSSDEKIYYPSIYLNIEQAPGLDGHEVGDKVLMIIEAEVCSHSKDENGKNVRENFTVDCKKIGCISM
jgi:hypothetical protein